MKLMDTKKSLGLIGVLSVAALVAAVWMVARPTPGPETALPADDAASAADAASSADKRRGLAALSLARLILTTEPRRAASVLRESFGAMPAGLVEDALARRVEAEGRAGNFAEARRLAAEYERRFPSGQRLREVTRWSGD